MSELPPELRGFMEGIREQIDQITPDVPAGGEWTRTEIVALSVIQFLEGIRMILTISDATPGLPPGIAGLVYSDPAARETMARMCGDAIEWLINDVDNAA